MKEVMLLDEPQEAQATTTCPPWCPEEAFKPEGAAGLEKTAADPQDMWKQPPLLSPGFEPLLSVHGPPPLKDMLPLAGIPKGEDIPPLARIPKGAQLDLTSISPMQMAYFRSEPTGTLQYQYEMHVTGSLCMGPPDTLGLPDTEQEVTEQWIKHVIYSEPKPLPSCKSSE